MSKGIDFHIKNKTENNTVKGSDQRTKAYGTSDKIDKDALAQVYTFVAPLFVLLIVMLIGYTYVNSDPNIPMADLFPDVPMTDMLSNVADNGLN